MATALVEVSGAGRGAKQPGGEGNDSSKPRFDVSFDALARNFGVDAVLDQGGVSQLPGKDS